MLHEFSGVFTGGLHSYNRAATIDMKLKAPLPVKVDKAPARSTYSLAEQRSAHHKQALPVDECPDLSILNIMAHIEQLESLNETFYFKFDKQADQIANQALYITIKKAFTPFAALHMLKQLQLCH